MNSLLYRLHDFFLDRREMLLAKPLRRERITKDADGVTFALVPFDLFNGTVWFTCHDKTHVVLIETVGQRFDQRGPVAVSRTFNRTTSHVINQAYVLSVYDNTTHAISLCALRNAVLCMA